MHSPLPTTEPPAGETEEQQKPKFMTEEDARETRRSGIFVATLMLCIITVAILVANSDTMSAFAEPWAIAWVITSASLALLGSLSCVWPRATELVYKRVPDEKRMVLIHSISGSMIVLVTMDIFLLLGFVIGAGVILVGAGLGLSLLYTTRFIRNRQGVSYRQMEVVTSKEELARNRFESKRAGVPVTRVELVQENVEHLPRFSLNDDVEELDLPQEKNQNALITAQLALRDMETVV